MLIFIIIRRSGSKELFLNLLFNFYLSDVNFYWDSASSRCLPRVGLGSGCTATYQCYYGTGLICSGGTCQCTTTTSTETAFGGEIFKNLRNLKIFYDHFIPFQKLFTLVSPINFYSKF